MTDLTSIHTLAVSKAIKAATAKAASGELPAGSYQGEVAVVVSYDLTKGEDYDQAIVAKADPWTLLAAALSHLNGVTVGSIVKEALTADPELVKSLKASAKTAIEAVKAPTDTRCNGKVTGKRRALADCGRTPDRREWVLPQPASP